MRNWWKSFSRERSPSYSPLFQVMFVLQNAPNAGLEFQSLSVSPVRLDTETARFDLTLSIHETAPGLSGALQYNTDLFHDATITRMIGHFQILLKGIVADADRRISDLPILTDAENHKLLVEWNETKRDYPKEKCLHQLFEEQVKRTPDSVAVIFEDQQLTYQELNTRSNQLAHYLRIKGVKPESLVGVCFERSPEMIVALLAILKAGGGYLPLDPSYPPERLSLILEQAETSSVLTQDSLVSRIPVTSACYCLDILDQLLLQESPEGLNNVSSPANAAYVLFTSGSTGVPKGVLMEHRPLVNLLSWQAENFGCQAGVRTLQFAPLSFDVSFQEIFSTLCFGGTLVMIDELERRDPKELLGLLKEKSIERIFLPFVALQQLAEGALDDCAAVESLREVIAAGEQLQITRPIMELFNRLPNCRLHNQYGPTESHVVTSFPLASRPSDWSNLPPIGRPIANTEIYLLDRHLNPVPVGVAGEIYIGGDGVARGYLNKPELTAEKFITHSFDGGTGKRLYKTGDLARYLPDGNIEFLGRMDEQVKIRGYRIELGEIEAVLGQHPAIREGVVLAREDSPGDKRLVAYIVAIPGCIPSTNELRSFLRQKLPEYMVPSIWMFLESLPLTASGKLNRQALPAPERSRPELDEGFSVPRTPTEELLANIWAEVLKLDKVGIYDNFFELGGHSLMATQVVARIREALNVELPLRRLFRGPTIRGLATIIAAERQSGQTRHLPPIRPANRGGDLPLSFAQQRLWFIDQLEPESSVYNVPAAWRLSGPLDFTALQRSVNEIVRRHEVLRTSFVIVDGQPIQQLQPFMTLSLDLINLAGLSDNERESTVELQVKEEIQKPFDLARGPLLRAKLLKLSDDDHVLLLTMHHIVSDGWSTGVLFRELSRLYGAFARGNPSPLDDLPIQYADYAVWQRGWLQGDVLESQLAYWRRQLENVTVLQLPKDRRRPTVQRYRGARERVTLDAALTKKLCALSRDENATLYITLLAAFQLLLSRYSGQEDIAVGSPTAGRSTRELEGLIGFFVNTLVLRGDLSNNPTFREFLRRMRDVALEAYAHQDVPFEKLVEELSPRRDLNISPLFQVMFVLQNDPRENFELKGLSARSVSVNSETSKFDLLLSLWESERGLAGTLEYATDLFEAATVARMLSHFQVLLEGIVTDPDRRISDLPVLTEAEKHQLLVEWNDTKTEYPRDKCVHELFGNQAERTPDAVAVLFENQQLTYRELNQRANQLAHYLWKFGVGPETLVGICVERSLEMIIGLLGILKAGGAYVPLDPSYPKERLEFMLQDSKVGVLLTQKGLFEVLSQDTARVIYLDTDWAVVSKESDENPTARMTAESLAYVIYTSGSTGQPHGVAIEHRNAVAFLSWAHSSFSKEELSGVLASTSICFDLSAFEIFAPLTCGGTIIVAENTLALTAIPNRSKVTLVNTVPSAIDELLRLDAILPSVRVINLAGESLSIELVKRLYESTSVHKVHDLYGPSESTTYSTWTCRGADGPQTIGRPIPNSQVYILDAHRNPVPIGAVGEIYIGGDGVSRGYLNQPELTAEKFIIHSFDDEPAKRLYKTGDLARYLPDGNIEFLGRMDDQVKIRGHRIELGEIETVLRQHPAIQEAVVLVQKDDSEDKFLIAYILPVEHLTPANDDLKNHLRKKLPDYMVPRTFVHLDFLPRTTNGKIDRRALPAPQYGHEQANDTFVPPRNSLEESIAKVWREVLNLERIGVHDNFFDLGGHSLKATQVVSRLQRTFGSKIVLRDMFDFPTIEELAEVARILQTGVN